jgi:hypothetical protein
MAALAAALAEAVDGRVVLPDSHFFSVGAGIYTADAFRAASPRQRRAPLAVD